MIKSGEEIVRMYEHFSPTSVLSSRNYLIELIDCALKEAYKIAQDDVFLLARELEKKGVIKSEER